MQTFYDQSDINQYQNIKSRIDPLSKFCSYSDQTTISSNTSSAQAEWTE